jgi:hypothetical protein
MCYICIHVHMIVQCTYLIDWGNRTTYIHTYGFVYIHVSRVPTHTESSSGAVAKGRTMDIFSNITKMSDWRANMVCSSFPCTAPSQREKNNFRDNSCKLNNVDTSQAQDISSVLYSSLYALTTCLQRCVPTLSPLVCFLSQQTQQGITCIIIIWYICIIFGFICKKKNSLCQPIKCKAWITSTWRTL